MKDRDHNTAYVEMLEWLSLRSLQGWDVPTLLDGVVGKLADFGISMYRVHFGIPVLNPLYVVGAYTWYPEKGVVVDNYARGIDNEEAYTRSPIKKFYDSGATEGRIRIRAGTESDSYPMLVQAAAGGGTDYFLQLVGFDDRSGMPGTQEGVVMSWISSAEGGFSDDDIALLQRLGNPLCVELKSLTQKRLVADILHANLGGYSADRVYDGQIQRGDGDVIDAVILFCDLRGSSKLAEHYDLKGFLGVLNDYYEITAGAVIEGGGEVLRYIGDASLAIFPFERYASEKEACQAAIDVAFNAVQRGERVNAEREKNGEPQIDFGIGLHTGTVMYGNIGTRERIEFTVIGKAANEAARIEAQCKELGETILVSKTFADQLKQPWHSHGSFSLRNIGKPIEILSPA